MSREERPKLSFSERDKLLKEKKQGYSAPRGRAAEARAKAETDQALKSADALFSGAKGGSDGARLGAAVDEARGSAGFDAACHAYLEALGPPGDIALASAFLDSDDTVILSAGLESLRSQQAAGTLTINRGLRSRLRMLAEHNDDDVAYGAEDLLS